MKYKIAVFFCLTLTLFALLFGCAKSYSLSFGQETYYVKEGETVTPDVRVRPAKNGYVLSVANATVASTEDGKTLLGLKNGAKTTIVVTSGGLRAEATLIVSDKEQGETQQYEFKKTFYVTFVLTNYADVELREETLSVVPYVEGDPVTEALPLYTGYATDGWYFDRTCTQKLSTFEDVVRGDLTLYARVSPHDNPFTFSGNNEITGILYSNQPHDELVFPETHFDKPVVGIAENAFLGDTRLKSAVIPACYTRIGAHAFSGCTNLVRVTLGEGSALKEIGAFAFSAYSTEEEDASEVVDEACASLVDFVLPDGVESIGEFAFYGCEKYAPTVPASLTTIPYGAYYGTAIARADLTNVTTVEAYAFGACKSLNVVEHTERVEDCGAKAFAGSAICETGLATKPYIAYADTILLEANNSQFGKKNLGKYHLKAETTLIADGAFNGYNHSEVTIYFDKAGVKIGYDAFLDEAGVCLVVPEDALADYLDDNPFYQDKFCVRVDVAVTDEDAANFGTHTLLKFSETKYYYDQFTKGTLANGNYKSPRVIDLSLLPMGRYVTRMNARAINLYTLDLKNHEIAGGNLETLRLGRVSEIAFMAVQNCAKLTEIDLSEGLTVAQIEKDSFQLTTLPVLRAVYVPADDLPAYRTAWKAVGSAVWEKLTVKE